MKERSNHNLTEPFERDELGIRASMEGIEPEAGARERMLQNIMKKAAMAQEAEGRAATESSAKAEILSIDAAKKEKKAKNRWKLYVPMLAAAAIILTVGTIFFVTITRQSKSAPQQDLSPAKEQDINNAQGMIPTYEQDHKGGDAEPGEFPDHITDVQDSHGEDSKSPVRPPQTAAPNDAQPTGEASNASGKTWSAMTLDRAAMSVAAEDMEIVEAVEDDSSSDYLVVSHDDHEYVLQYQGDAKSLKEFGKDALKVKAVYIPADPDISLEELTFSDRTGWRAEWTVDGENRYYLFNRDDATKEDILETVRKMKENSEKATK